MAIQLNEPVIAALRDRLEDDLPAAITSLNASVTDGFTISNPVNVYDFIPPVALLLDFPTVGIGDAPSTFEDDQGFSMTGRHRLLICAYLSDPDQRALAWKLRRYSQAIVRVLRSDQQIGPGWGSGVERIDPGPTLTDNPEAPQTFTSWVGVAIWVKTDEE